MANEEKKDFNAMLHDNKDMPKFQVITDQKSIEKYGGNNMYFAPPIDYDKVMKKIPYGKVITIGKIREFFAKENDADFTEPITAGIFVSIAAWASYQRTEDKTPYWRTLKANGELNSKYPGGIEVQKEKDHHSRGCPGCDHFHCKESLFRRREHRACGCRAFVKGLYSRYPKHHRTGGGYRQRGCNFQYPCQDHLPQCEGGRPGDCRRDCAPYDRSGGPSVEV